MRPSPEVATEGYLIAFSRTNNLKDLRAFFGDSDDVFLVDSRVAPRSKKTRSKNPEESDDTRDQVRDFLIGKPFRVARDAGPYHVVRDLILPRMAAFAELKRFNKDHINSLWRMVEYIRQKWPTYVSEYRNNRRPATEEEIASELSSRFHVVAKVRRKTSSVKRAVPIANTYLTSRLLGFEGMDVVLKGIPDVAVVDSVHEKTLSPVSTRGRQRAKVPSVTDFHQMLGGHVGPRVHRASRVFISSYIAEVETPWVDWSVISEYEGWKKRDKRLDGDWVCPDLDLLIARWDSLGAKERHRRGHALWRSIQEDWEGLRGTVRSRLAYFYRVWRSTQFEAYSTWVGKLSRLRWTEAGDRTLRLPT
jgi:hypothetical protein